MLKKTGESSKAGGMGGGSGGGGGSYVNSGGGIGGSTNPNGKMPNGKSPEENILDIINDVYKRQYAVDFREPVDVMALGLSDYYEIVQRPMDLSSLKNAFLDGQYKTIRSVWEDFDLIVRNCKSYNRLPDHPINAKADMLKARVDKNFQKLLDDYLAAGLDGETVELSADLSEIKAKEDRKRKTKLDGLDEKNILINNDKRQQLLPGALNERKMFEVQQQQDAIFPSVAASNNSLAGSLNSTAAAKMNSNASTEEYQFMGIHQTPSSVIRESNINNNNSNIIIGNEGNAATQDKQANKLKQKGGKSNSAAAAETLRHRIEEMRRQVSQLSVKQNEAKNLYDQSRRLKHNVQKTIKGFYREESALIGLESGLVPGAGGNAATSLIPHHSGGTPTGTTPQKLSVGKSITMNEEGGGNLGDDMQPTKRKQESHRHHAKGSSLSETERIGSLEKRSSVFARDGGDDQNEEDECDDDEEEEEFTPRNLHIKSKLPSAVKLQLAESVGDSNILRLGISGNGRRGKEDSSVISSGKSHIAGGGEDKRRMDDKVRREELRREEVKRNLMKKEAILMSEYQQQKQQQQQQKMMEEGGASTNLIKISLDTKSMLISPSLLPPAHQPSILSLDGPVEMRFSLDQKHVRRHYEEMVTRKQMKYKKLLEANLSKMHRVTEWMIREWAKKKDGSSSETLEYFKDILAKRSTICESLDVRKIQLFLKMFLYRLRDFHGDLKQDHIEKLKNISEKMCRIGSRITLYKAPHPQRDHEPVNGEEDSLHPMKRLQEETLEIEREMKQFRRMLSRDVLKNSENGLPAVNMSDSMVSLKIPAGKKSGAASQGGYRNQADSGSGGQGYNNYEMLGHRQNSQQQQQQQQSSSVPVQLIRGDMYFGDGGGYDQYDQRAGAGGQLQQAAAAANAAAQPQMSEIFEFFVNYNKLFDRQINDLSRVQAFLANTVHETDTITRMSRDIIPTLVKVVADGQAVGQQQPNGTGKRRSGGSSAQEEVQFDFIDLIDLVQSRKQRKVNEVEGVKILNTMNAKDEEDQQQKRYEKEEVDMFEGFGMELKSAASTMNKQRNQSAVGPLKIEERVFGFLDEDEDSLSEQRESLPFPAVSSRDNYSDSKIEEEKVFRNNSINNNYAGAAERIRRRLDMHRIEAKIPFDLFKNETRKRRILEVGQAKVLRALIRTDDKQLNASEVAWLQSQTQFEYQIQENMRLQQFGFSGLVMIDLMIDLKLEREFSEIQGESLQSSPSQPNPMIEFQVKNRISHTARAALAELESVQSQVHGVCAGESLDWFVSSCPEDVQRVTSHTQLLQNYFEYFKQNRQQNNDPKRDIFDADAACIVKLSYFHRTNKQEEQADATFNWFVIQLLLITPFSELSELSIQCNGVDLFNPQVLAKSEQAKIKALAPLRF